MGPGAKPGRGSGGRRPQLKQFVLADFDCRNVQSLKISRNSPPNS